MIRTAVLLVSSAAMLLASGCGGSSSKSVSASLGASSLPTISPPAIVPGPLNGQPTARAKAIRRPLAIMVENFAPDARPQSGLTQASTVIETLAEGGITRFMAIYLERDSVRVGPVRSTRPYYNHWASGFHTILTHVGGSDEALAALWNTPQVFNIDENRWERSLTDTGTPLFWRSHDRLPPHNMYTSTYKLRAYAARNKQNWAYAEAYLQHKLPAAPSKRGHSQTIQLHFRNPIDALPQPQYDVRYVYDRASNAYLRYLGGAPHIDANTGKQLRPANVIVMQTGPATAEGGAEAYKERILLPTLGKGTAFFFRDGKVEKGVWQQPKASMPLRFYGKHGRQVALNPGQTWIDVVPPSSPWSYR